MEFEIFPNQSPDFLTIKYTHKTNLKFSVFSSIGKLEMNGELDNINNIIDLSEFEPQLYILKIDCNSYKIIKE